jgi:probable HAF family extracellular repeat protein
MKRSSSFPIIISVVLLTAASALCAAQSSYTVTDLGVPNSSNGYSVARGINATGEVTGASGTLNSNLSDVITWSNGVMTSLGTLGGNTGVGNSINALGQVASYSTSSAGTYRAFLATNGVLADIGDLGGGSAVAYGLNDSGQVVGSAVTSDESNDLFFSITMD